MPEARSAGVQLPAEAMMPGTPRRGGTLERGLLIGGKSVPASSGQLTEDVSPWDGETYARVSVSSVTLGWIWHVSRALA
jgi:hypothetical protein